MDRLVMEMYWTFLIDKCRLLNVLSFDCIVWYDERNLPHIETAGYWGYNANATLFLNKYGLYKKMVPKDN